jgi:endonuclease YncB( thermonuclease family)
MECFTERVVHCRNHTLVSRESRDTIEVLHNTHPQRVRLSGIDCPKNGQAFGKRARQAAFVCGVKGRPDQVDPSFPWLLHLALPEAP